MSEFSPLIYKVGVKGESVMKTWMAMAPYSGPKGKHRAAVGLSRPILASQRRPHI